jgi:hypothetical protein
MNQKGQSSAIEGAARVGYAARGVVYLFVGGLAVNAAVGGGGKTTGSKGAMVTMLQQPFGRFLLGGIALGLVGYSIWRFIQAIRDVDHHGTDAKGLAIRGGLLTSAVIHLGLAVYAAALLSGNGGSGDGQSSQTLTAHLMAQPFGRWLVGLAGVAVIGAGVAQIIKGWRAGYEKHMDLGEARQWVAPVCRFGLVARGVVFVMSGFFLVVAAVRFDPQKARGLQGALESLQGQVYGPILLGVVALGLVAFGIYSILEMRYRRIV